MRNIISFIYQGISIIFLMIILILFDQGLPKTGVLLGEEINIYIKGGILFSIMTWIYMSIYFEFKRAPLYLKKISGKRLPFIWSSSCLIGVILFIIIASKGLFLSWIKVGSWFLYPMLICSMILYYWLVLIIVYRMSEKKKKVLHRSYAWGLGVLFIIAFVF